MNVDRITVSHTAMEKADRYLTPEQLKTVLREHTGYVCRRTSPNHDDLYPNNEFTLRGEFCGLPLDIVFAVEDDHVTVITQMSQHSDSLRGQFYEYVGDTAEDAVEHARS
ncbi:hypothetical protein [Haloarcula japonica]